MPYIGKSPEFGVRNRFVIGHGGTNQLQRTDSIHWRDTLHSTWMCTRTCAASPHRLQHDRYDAVGHGGVPE